MLDLHRLQEQLSDFSTYHAQEQILLLERLTTALDALRACGPYWEDLALQAESLSPKRLVATLLEDPTHTYPPPQRPTPLTVVAADGSQIYPDRHFEPSCYLLNISQIAFQYGTFEHPLMASKPFLKYRTEAADALDEMLDDTSAEVVSALRDEKELEALLEIALEARMNGRPLVALADGTLIRWMLRSMRNQLLEEALIGRYAALLARFQEEKIPLCSFISMPRNTEVINLLRIHLDEDEELPEADSALFGLMDRWVFEKTLPPGHRSATFRSSSHIQRMYGVHDRICYFYLHIPHPTGLEVGRVEMPAWIADVPDLLDLLHATILSECDKGEGYPMILSEAHEQAVIRARERDFFYEIIQRDLEEAGLRPLGSRKQASKRRPLV